MGNIEAVQYEDSKEESGDVKAENNAFYEYSVKVTAEDYYEIGVVGASKDQAKVTLYMGSEKLGDVTLGEDKKTYSLASPVKLAAGKQVLRMEVSGGTAVISRIKML